MKNMKKGCFFPLFLPKFGNKILTDKECKREGYFYECF